MPYLEPHLYSAAMVARGKLSPDLFLHAPERHGVRPQQRLVIEDSFEWRRCSARCRHGGYRVRRRQSYSFRAR